MVWQGKDPVAARSFVMDKMQCSEACCVQFGNRSGPSQDFLQSQTWRQPEQAMARRDFQLDATHRNESTINQVTPRFFKDGKHHQVMWALHRHVLRIQPRKAIRKKSLIQGNAHL